MPLRFKIQSLDIDIVRLLIKGSILYFLTATPIYIFAQKNTLQDTTTYWTSSFKKLKQTKARILFIEKHLLHFKRNTFDRIHDLLEQENDIEALLFWLYKKAEFWEPLGYKEQASTESIQQMLNLSRKHNYKMEEQIASFNITLQDYLAKKITEQQLYYQNLNHLNNISNLDPKPYSYYGINLIYYHIGNTFYSFGDYEKSLESLKKSLDYETPINHVYRTLKLNLIQAIYAHQKDYKNAILYAQKVYDFNYSLNPSQDPLKWREYFWQGLSSLDLASYYMELGDIKNAEKFANQGYKLSQLDYNYKDHYNRIFQKITGEFDALQVIIKLKLKLGKYSEVPKHFNRAETIRPYIRFSDPNNHFKILALYQNYTTFYEYKKDYEKAFYYSKLAKIMEDSLARRSDKRKLWQIAMRVDAERYQGKIQTAETETRFQERVRNIALLGLSLVIISAIIIYQRIKRDNNIIRKQRDLLESSLKEKETLIKEIHHRVKNNLQIISGLFEKQALKTQDETAKKLMKEGQDRIFSIALVHQNLYQNENLSSIEIKPYLEMLLKNIEKTQKPSNQEIELKFKIDDTSIDIDTAIPLGLILNELITNCYKYAFKNRPQGWIQIVFRPYQQGYLLQVEDNGQGIPLNFDLTKSKSLGLSLVRGLVRQLDGVLNYQSSAEGTLFSMHLRRSSPL